MYLKSSNKIFVLKYSHIILINNDIWDVVNFMLTNVKFSHIECSGCKFYGWGIWTKKLIKVLMYILACEAYFNAYHKYKLEEPDMECFIILLV